MSADDEDYPLSRELHDEAFAELRAGGARRLLEAHVARFGWPVDRPWVKAGHSPACACWKCLPHVVHGEPRHDRAGVFRYPCGHRVAISNDLQDEDFLNGASHGWHYTDPTRINCPGCERA